MQPTKFEQLEMIQSYIKQVEKTIDDLENNPPEYYALFCKGEELAHTIEIKQKSLAYLKRKFNKVLRTVKEY